ncbi:hypothetical protein NEMIN01_0729 [Nematocida minor]|uniref:uncharacterized protein n=1 Tax=Nematocida minor TaxID=1912983 RepID=UPI00221FC59E|nr:uncharacterized protein NEMIN01_0729 [Nematocida minor]KAI5189866.1 hypothetical protein NEMIN01_0729 [Nematocida minor]
MTRREVKLKVDMEGVLNACKSIDKECVEDVYTMYYSSSDTLLRFVKKLKVILSNNIKIESKYSEEENKAVLDIIMNDICQYLINAACGLGEITYKLCIALKNSNDKISKKMIAIIANDLIKPNSFIYRPEHGINMQFDKDKPLENIDPDDENADLSVRTYTLEVDSTGFTSMESFLQASAERLDAYNLYYFSALDDLNFTNDSNLLIEKYYSLSELYTKTYKNTDVLLIDYGTRLVYEKQKEIEELNKLIEEINCTSDDKKKDSLILQIYKLFSRKDLGIIYSIINNLRDIRYEKSVQINAINMVEYMINNNVFLEEKDGEKILNIGTNLYDFYKNYINSSIYFRELLEEKRNKIKKEKELCLQELEDEKALYSQLKEEETEEIEKVKCAINNIENEIHLLECDDEKEYIIGKYIFAGILQKSENLRYNLVTEQIKYIFKKIEAFANAQKIKTREAVKLHKRNEKLEELEEKETKESEEEKERVEAEPKSLFRRLISENGKVATIFTGTVALGVATAATLNNYYSNESVENSSPSNFKAARSGKLKND